MNPNAAAIRELLLAAGLSALLFAAGTLVPLVGAIAGFFSSAPLIVLAARRGLLSGLAAAAVAAAALLAGGMPWFIAALHAAEHGLPATWIGVRLGRGRRLFPAVGAAALLLAAAAVAAVALWSARTGGSLTEVIERQLIETVQALSGAPGAPGATGGLPRAEDLRAFVAAVWRVLPAIALVGIFLELGLNGLLAARILLRSGHAGVRLPDVAGFRLPDWPIWLFIASLALAWAPHPAAAAAGRNLAIPLALLYLLQGLAVSLHLAARTRLSWLGTVLITVALLQPYLLVVPFALGLLDFRFNFRARGGGTPPAQAA